MGAEKLGEISPICNWENRLLLVVKNTNKISLGIDLLNTVQITLKLVRIANTEKTRLNYNLTR